MSHIHKKLIRGYTDVLCVIVLYVGSNSARLKLASWDAIGQRRQGNRRLRLNVCIENY